MNKKLDIKNPRFKLVDSTLKGYKEIDVMFNYNGEDYKHFIFVKEGKNVNYINEAKRQFNQDVKSGNVLKSIKPNVVNHRPWLIAGASILGVASLTLAGLFTWKMITNNGGGSTPTETDCIVTFESNGADKHIDTMKVKSGTIISAPTPEKTDYTFGGWYEKSDLSGDPFNFDTTINKDYTFYAKWTGGPAPTPTLYTLTVNAGEDAKFPNGADQITLKVEPDSNLLQSLSILDKPIYKGEKLSQTFDAFTYNGEPIDGSETVSEDDMAVEGSYRNKTLEECSWKEISDISAKGAAYAEAFFGPVIENDAQGNIVRHSIEKTVMVNGQEHKVRIIGYGQDYTDLSDESTAIGITFEFKNLISDANGNSLVTQWNDTNTTEGSSHNYLKSSIRYALNRETDEGGCNHILWAQKGETTWSADYKNKCVLDMLPNDLVSVLKAPSKYINIKDGSWGEQTINDKLFLLSPAEMGRTGHQYEEPSTSAYFYYESADNSVRVKKQVNNEETSYDMLPINDPESGQLYGDIVVAAAGYNGSTAPTTGGYLWSRSPYTQEGNEKSVWHIEVDGNANYFTVYDGALAVAPAFCI